MSARPVESKKLSNAPLGLSRREQFRLLVWFALGLVVAGLILKRLGPSDGSEDIPTVLTPVESSRPEGPPVDLTIGVPPWRPPLQRLNEIISEKTPIDRLKTFPEAFNILGDLVRKRPHTNFLHDPERKAVGGYERLLSVETISDPARGPDNRGRPVEIVGLARTSSPTDARAQGLDPEVFPAPLLSGILDVMGLPVRYLLVGSSDQDAATPISLLTGGERIKLMGVFFRVADEVLEGTNASTTLPVIIAKRVVPALDLDVRDSLPERTADELQEAENHHILRAPHQERTFYDVMGYLLGKGKNLMPEGELQVLPKGMGPLTRPDDFRLKPVRVRGYLVYLNKESFEFEDMRAEDGPTLGYWHAIVADANPAQNCPISLAIPEPMVSPELKAFFELPAHKRGEGGSQIIEVDGLYYRVMAYQSQGPRKSKGPDVRMPLVIAATNVSLVAPAAQLNQRPFWIKIFLGLGVLIAILVAMLLRDRKRSARLETELRAGRLERRRSRPIPAVKGDVRKKPSRE